MKKFLLLCSLACAAPAMAQDFTGQHSGYIHFYKPLASNTIHMVRCDSADAAGADSLYWLRPQLREGDGDTSYCAFWGGPQCLFMRDAPGLMGLRVTASNRFVEYYNHLDNNSSFDLHLAVGDSTLVFEDSLQRVRIKLLSATATTSFGNPDSLLSFTFIHTDLMDNVLPTTLNGSAIAFSKLYGMMNGYAMDSFPYVLTPVTLEGVRGPNVGFDGLSKADVYDFQVGDWYETHSHAGSGPPNNNYHRYTILSRTDFADRIEYNVREDHQTLSTTGPPPYPYLYFTDTNVHVRYKTQWLDENMPFGVMTNERYYLNNSILDCNVTAYSYEATVDECYTECPGTACIGGGDCFMASRYTFRFTAQAGATWQQSESIAAPWGLGYEELIYLNANGIECGAATLGVPTPIMQEQVKIYPNPAQENVTIEAGDLTALLVSVTVSDLAGQTVLTPAVSGNGKILFGIAALKAGTYWVKLETTQGPLTKKLVVIH